MALSTNSNWLDLNNLQHGQVTESHRQRPTNEWNEEVKQTDEKEGKAKITKRKICVLPQHRSNCRASKGRNICEAKKGTERIADSKVESNQRPICPSGQDQENVRVHEMWRAEPRYVADTVRRMEAYRRVPQIAKD